MMRRRVLWTGGGALVSLLTVYAADRLSPPDLSRIEDRSVSVLAANGDLLRAFPATGGYWRLSAAPESVDPLYLRMLVTYEDKRFFHHPGVDPLALGRALWQAVSGGRIVSGASTLTMQTARLLDPRKRSIGAKLIQMARAVQLERRLTKDEILAAYLTVAPFGGNLEGVRAASLAYFGKEPRRLTPGEAALLVALPKWPERARPDRHPARARAARDSVLERMAQSGVLTQTQLVEARQEPVPTARRALPFLAPHLARHLRHAGGEAIVTTIDLDLQRAAERIAANWRRRIPALASLAIQVRHNKTGAVVAYVGSAGFNEDRRAGQVDMVRAVRSPGSTLKPFIYALAFDDGIAHPETLVDDSPTAFGDYRPENFSREFSGEVTVREALQRSLNVPAVAVLDKVGSSRFAARLTRAGVTLSLPTLIPEGGLAVALGGVGVTLTDLVDLYAALADAGKFRRSHVVRGGDKSPEMALVGAASAWQVMRILEGVPRPGAGGIQRAGRRSIAWKTGTSYGFRDAWAVGSDGDHTVGVWIGRADGTPIPGSVGHRTAGPLLFAVFDVLPVSGQQLAERVPEGVNVQAGKTLPRQLRRLSRRTVIGAPGRAVPPRIVFPPDGSEIEIRSKEDAVIVEVAGGTAPLKWLVDGKPIVSSKRRRATRWRPDGVGFSRITVIDSLGRRAAADIRIR